MERDNGENGETQRFQFQDYFEENLRGVLEEIGALNENSLAQVRRLWGLQEGDPYPDAETVLRFIEQERMNAFQKKTPTPGDYLFSRVVAPTVGSLLDTGERSFEDVLELAKLIPTHKEFIDIHRVMLYMLGAADPKKAVQFVHERFVRSASHMRPALLQAVAAQQVATIRGGGAAEFIGDDEYQEALAQEVQDLIDSLSGEEDIDLETLRSILREDLLDNLEIDITAEEAIGGVVFGDVVHDNLNKTIASRIVVMSDRLNMDAFNSEIESLLRPDGDLFPGLNEFVKRVQQQGMATREQTIARITLLVALVESIVQTDGDISQAEALAALIPDQKDLETLKSDAYISLVIEQDKTNPIHAVQLIKENIRPPREVTIVIDESGAPVEPQTATYRRVLLALVARDQIMQVRSHLQVQLVNDDEYQRVLAEEIMDSLASPVGRGPEDRAPEITQNIDRFASILRQDIIDEIKGA